MIISAEFLQATNACEPGMAAVHELGIIGLEYNEFTQTLIQNGYTEFAAWTRQAARSAAAIKFLGDYTVVKYMVLNPLTGQYQDAADEQAARVLRDQILAEYVQARVISLIDVQRAIKNDAGMEATETVVL